MPDPRLRAAKTAAFAKFDALRADGSQTLDAVEQAADAFLAAIEAWCDDPITETEQLETELHQRARGPVRAAAPRPGVGNPQAASALKQRDPLPDDLLTSPFRFVALNDVVIPPEPAVLCSGLDRPLPGGFCGRIEVEWAAETPLLIGEPHRERDPRTSQTVEFTGPMQLGAGGDWIIPGSTIRGCLRASMEIVAGGRLSQINAHHRYGLRDFDHPRVRQQQNGKEVPLLDKVQAGWLRHAPGHRADAPRYEIVACKEWRTIAIADLPFRQGADQYAWRHEWLGLSLEERYRRAVVQVDGKTIRFDQTKALRFADATPGGVGQLLPRDDGAITGTLVFSNRSPARPSPDVIKQMEELKWPGQPKKREYVFIDHPVGEAKMHEVTDAAWRRFELINSKPGQNRLEPDGSWR